MTVPPITAVAGPRWTRKRLVGMLIDCYGPSPRGAVDAAAVAAYLDVAESTVRRWISGGRTHANNRHPTIPARRLTQLQIGPPEVERRNDQQSRYALAAIAGLAAQQNITPYWREHGWLDEHTVTVIALTGTPWHQVAYSGGSARSSDVLRRRGAVVDSAVVPTRFHAQALTHAVMLTQQCWRVHPAPSQLKVGNTTVWMADAPAVDLKALTRQLFPAPRGRRSSGKRTGQRAGA